MGTVNKEIAWQPLVRCLSLEPLSDSAPTTAKCPACQKVSLWLLPSQVGVYGQCSACDWAGDMIALAAAGWKLEAAAALETLRSQGFLSDSVDDATITACDELLPFHAEREGRWKTIKAGWLTASATARESLPESLRSGSLPLSGLSRFSGVADWSLLQAAGVCRKSRYGLGLRLRKKAYVVFPGYAAPGLVSSCFLVPVGQALSQGVSTSCQLPGTDVPAMGPAVLLPQGLVAPVLKDIPYTFLTTEPYRAAVLQLRGQLLSQQVLPVSGVVPSKQGDIKQLPWFESTPGDRVIVWGSDAAAVLRTAKQLDARMAWSPAVESADEKTEKTDVRSLLLRVAATATPWRVWLEKRLTKLSEVQRRSLLQRAGIYLTDPEVQDILRPANGQSVSFTTSYEKRTLRFRNTQVIVDDGQWKTLSGELILGGTLHVRYTESRRIGKTYETWYHGEFRRGGQRLPFSVTEEQAAGIGTYLNRESLRHTDIGVISFAAAWERQLIPLALRLQPPPPHLRRGRGYGWDKAFGGFVFSGFAVTARGTLLPERYVHRPRRRREPRAPRIGPPYPNCGKNTQLAECLRDSRETAEVWSLASLLVGNGIAPASRLRPVPIVISDTALVEAVLGVAKALGCPRLLWSPGVSDTPDRACYQTYRRRRHDTWPAILLGDNHEAVKCAATVPQLLAGSPLIQRSLLLVPRPAELAALTWPQVHGMRTLPRPQPTLGAYSSKLFETVAAFVSRFLRDYLVTETTPGSPPAMQLLDAVAAAWSRATTQTDNSCLPLSRRLLLIDHAARVVHTCREVAKTVDQAVIDQEDGRVVVDWGRIEDWLTTAGGAPAPFETLTQTLADTGHLLVAEPAAKRWVVDTSWWVTASADEPL